VSCSCYLICDWLKSGVDQFVSQSDEGTLNLLSSGFSQAGPIYTTSVHSVLCALRVYITALCTLRSVYNSLIYTTSVHSVLCALRVYITALCTLRSVYNSLIYTTSVHSVLCALRVYTASLCTLRSVYNRLMYTTECILQPYVHYGVYITALYTLRVYTVYYVHYECI
jgi:hypothetical protein